MCVRQRQTDTHTHTYNRKTHATNQKCVVLRCCVRINVVHGTHSAERKQCWQQWEDPPQRLQGSSSCKAPGACTGTCTRTRTSPIQLFSLLVAQNIHAHATNTPKTPQTGTGMPRRTPTASAVAAACRVRLPGAPTATTEPNFDAHCGLTACHECWVHGGVGGGTRRP